LYLKQPYALTGLAARTRKRNAGLTLPRAVVYHALPAPEQRLFMKLIIAIIQPSRLEAVKAALSEVEVFRLTIMDVQGFGRQKGHAEVFRGHEVAVNLLRKVQLQIAVNEEFVEPTINAIIKGGRTGKTGEIGDGKIFVLPLEDCIRIRTGERGKEAI
jgi:nitrogen regulatory protein P-II 1